MPTAMPSLGFYSLPCLLASVLILQGCEVEVEPPAYYDIPAYSWDQPISVENSSWQSCHFDSVQNVHVRQLWAFGKNTLRLSEHEHSSTDATCTSNSTLLWRHQYRAADDQKIRVAKGWADINGVETLNAGAPTSQDGLGALPAQPNVRRVKWAFSRADAGTGTPSVAPAALLQILFMDISAQPFRLFVGPNSGSKDSEGFPSYLKSFRPLVYVQP